jgi:disulfide bond formation protein DsbB
MATALSDRNTSRLLWGMAAACAVALGLALAAQYGWDMRPCPWCVLQRLLFVVIGVLCAVGALAPQLRRPLAGLSLLTAVAGVAAALYQHTVAAASFSCNLTFADKVVSGLKLDSLLPSVFSATASCAEAAVSVLGVPFAYWSLALFVLLGAAAAAVVGRARRPQGH